MDAMLEEAELQQELQRISTQFVERVTQASTTLEHSVRPRVRDEALKKALLYVSSAMEIVTGPVPEVNLLDMIVFARLSRRALTQFWIPNVYGEQAREVKVVFFQFERELKAVAARVLSPTQRKQLDASIAAWVAENPRQVRVEGVRLSDFSAAAAEPARQAAGLLSSVKEAKRTANQALVLSERVLFLVHRLPYVWRLQARLGAREILSDSLRKLITGGPVVVLALASSAFATWLFWRKRPLRRLLVR